MLPFIEVLVATVRDPLTVCFAKEVEDVTAACALLQLVGWRTTKSLAAPVPAKVIVAAVAEKP